MIIFANMKAKKKLKDMSVDEFLAEGFSCSDSSSESELPASSKKISPKKAKKDSTKKSSVEKEMSAKRKRASEKNQSLKKNTKKSETVLKKKSDKKEEKADSAAVHTATLNKLKDKDPEFYEFLKGEDKNLLNFEVSDEEDDDGEESSSDEEESDKEEMESDLDIQSTDSEEEDSLIKVKRFKSSANDEDDLSDVDADADEEPESISRKRKAEDDLTDSDLDDDDRYHKLPDALEEVTDSEDDEEEQERAEKASAPKKRRDSRKIVTIKMINQWTTALQAGSTDALKQIVEAFRAAVTQAGGESGRKTEYKVEGGIAFNAIVRMCIRELPGMLNRYIKLPKSTDPNRPVLPLHSEQWKFIRKDMTLYLADLIELMSQLVEPNVLNVVLKHVSQMIPYYACNPKLTKNMLRKLISVWSKGEETTRVLAFLSIIRLTRLRQDTFMEFVLKHMYMTYVKNCKFTSPSTLPMINFMQRSLVEIFALDHELTYQYGFMYIRQLAIHLRNAITVRKKDTCQAVYNWQYIHSLDLWSRTLSMLYPSEVLQPLIYPLVQTIIGTIKLIPTARYFPLRFHCVRALNLITHSTKTFIPTLPFLVEIFDIMDLSKESKSVNFKPFNFSCILKLSKGQLHDKAFKDGVIDQLYEHLMETLHIHAHTIGFPELVLPAIVQLKKFVKTCKVMTYTKQIKQIIDKVDETSKVIAQRRKATSLRIDDNKAVELWEKKGLVEGTPLGKYYVTWRKLRDRELQYDLAGKERISMDNLPTIVRKPAGAQKASAEEKKEFSGLFPSDSEGDDSDDSEDDANRFLPKDQKPYKKSGQDDSDYSDFDESDLAKLAESASEDDDEEDDDDDIDEEDDDAEDDDEDDQDAENMEIPDQDDIVEDFQFSSEEDD